MHIEDKQDVGTISSLSHNTVVKMFSDASRAQSVELEFPINRYGHLGPTVAVQRVRPSKLKDVNFRRSPTSGIKVVTHKV